jgi:hypothetical protein
MSIYKRLVGHLQSYQYRRLEKETDPVSSVPGNILSLIVGMESLNCPLIWNI